MERRIHDPVALAQGHRLMRAASNLTLPAWILGVLGMVGVSLTAMLEFEYGLVSLILMTTIGLGCWMWVGGEEIVARTAAPRGDRMPDEILDLLVLVDGMIEALERGEDATFDVELGRLGLALVRLQAAAHRHLEDRGADPLRLRQSVCKSNLAAESPEPLSPDRRRALHQELVRFAAAARGRPCGDPYRSRVGSVGLLGALLDPSLAVTRRRYLVILTLLVIAWIAVSNELAGASLHFCNPTVG
ncbi:MAG TPA: hypothetical protein VM869_32845, partial [Enhygromyxa sp.]|nr:hypothetical protein [Enhygromyxa sp.]